MQPMKHNEQLTAFAHEHYRERYPDAIGGIQRHAYSADVRQVLPKDGPYRPGDYEEACRRTVAMLIHQAHQYRKLVGAEFGYFQVLKDGHKIVLVDYLPEHEEVAMTVENLTRAEQ